MTKDELFFRLQDIQRKYRKDGRDGPSNKDPESTHIEVDRALLEFINDARISELHERLAPWYA